MDLGVGQRRAERLGDPASPAGLDRVAVAVLGDDALEQQVPPSWLASLLDAVLEGAGPLLAFGGAGAVNRDRISATLFLVVLRGAAFLPRKRPYPKPGNARSTASNQDELH